MTILQKIWSGIVLSLFGLLVLYNISLKVYQVCCGEDTISSAVTVFVPAQPAMVVNSVNSNNVYVVPEKTVDQELTMHLVGFNYDAQPYDTIQKMKEKGLRPADIAECDAYIKTMKAQGNTPERLICLGSLVRLEGSQPHGMKRTWFPEIYPKIDGRYGETFRKTVHCLGACLAVRL